MFLQLLKVRQDKELEESHLSLAKVLLATAPQKVSGRQRHRLFTINLLAQQRERRAHTQGVQTHHGRWFAGGSLRRRT